MIPTIPEATALMALLLPVCVALPAHAADAPIGVVELTCVDDNATGYGTFQSHNQKVVCNQQGLFMTHIRTRNEPYTAQTWRLSRSTDGGKTFATIFEETAATSAPALETDEQGNVYAGRPDFVDGNAYLYRFLAADGYAKPVVATIPNGAAGKYCMMYDGPRRQLYWFAHNETFHIIGLDGTVRSCVRLIQPGPSAVLQYPLLSLDRDGTLYAAWTTQRHGVYLYWDIHVMRSPDGGQTWQKLDGTALSLPVVADETGPSDRITLDDEFEVHTWLSSMMAKNGKLHFVYMAQLPEPREHYMRYDLATALRDIDLQPELKGSQLSLRGLDGFFASRASEPGSPLYCVMASNGRVGCLASEDNGQTWRDHAISSESGMTLYSVGGCREITPDGYIIGSFTDQGAKPAPRVYFLRIRVLP